ncbi:hypothetical protein N7463_007651 [Penicillium fimorum]|uniref:Uncharacterized protein n=1 Tax=Penicillium fimorum TaxID=1882269 RepID=A0A9W9XWV5_9EURO|nr:hypothetical protein N7463_007651 [Penicillium fimorum]
MAASATFGLAAPAEFGLTANINKTSVMDISAINIDLEHRFVDIPVCDLDVFEDYWNEHDYGPQVAPLNRLWLRSSAREATNCIYLVD